MAIKSISSSNETQKHKEGAPSRCAHATTIIRSRELALFRTEREKRSTLHVVCECSACLPLPTPRSLSLLPCQSAPACHGIKTNARRRDELVRLARSVVNRRNLCFRFFASLIADSSSRGCRSIRTRAENRTESKSRFDRWRWCARARAGVGLVSSGERCFGRTHPSQF